MRPRPASRTERFPTGPNGIRVPTSREAGPPVPGSRGGRRGRSPARGRATRRGRWRGGWPPPPARGRTPLAAANTRSPSKRVCDGTTARAIPSCAAMAIRCAAACVRHAFVATTAMVVFTPGASARCLPRNVVSTAGARSGSPAPPNSLSISNGAAQNCRPPGTVTDPTGLAATRAPTEMPFPRSRDAEPSPPLRLAVVAPVPAPAVPSAKSRPAFASACRPRPRYGFSVQSLSPPFRMVEEDRAGDDRDPHRPHREAAAGRGEGVRDPRRGVEPERRSHPRGTSPSARSTNRSGREEVRLPRTRRAPHDVHRRDERLLRGQYPSSPT